MRREKMHSFDAPSGATYHHNGDFSGNVEFTVTAMDRVNGVKAVPFADLKALVAQHVRNVRIEAIENGDDYSLDAVAALEQMTDDQVLGIPVIEKVAPIDPPITPVMRLVKLQPAPFVDAISVDGHVGTKLPYPFFVTEAGDVEGQDFWRGDPLQVVGFQRDLAVQRIDLWWVDAVKDPQKAVRMYLVTTDANGGMGVHQTAIATVEVLER
jgi:hypothetical protein